MNVFKVFFMIFALSVLSSNSHAQLRTVPFVDISQYAGTWYQISHKPLIFEGKCICSRQVLAGEADGRISVYNSCNEPKTGELREIRGFATNNDVTTNAQFTIDFGLPHKGQYWIIGLGDNYEYAVVSDPSLISLYVLSKTPTLSPELYEEAVAKASEQLDVSGLKITDQSSCVYPVN